MDAKEKAIDLVDRFLFTYNKYNENCDMKQAKQGALIAVEEIVQTNPTIKGNSEDLITMIVQTKAYWAQVEIEINKL